jgi:hypothetical protein
VLSSEHDKEGGRAPTSRSRFVNTTVDLIRLLLPRALSSEVVPGRKNKMLYSQFEASFRFSELSPNFGDGLAGQAAAVMG